MKHIASAIGQPRTISDSEIGMPRGELVVATTGHIAEEIAVALAKVHPRKTDREVQSQMQRHGLSLRVETRTLFPTGPNGENLPMRTQALWAACSTLKPLDQIDTRKALEDFDRFMMPAPEEMLIGWLGRLSVMTVPRKMSEFDGEILIETYVDLLKHYPADVVYHALFKEIWKFWPTWAELSKVVEPLASHRLAMREALQRPHDPIEQVEPEKTDEEIAEERARIRQIGADAIAKMRSRLPKKDAKLWTKEEAAIMREATKPDVELARLRSKQFNSMKLTQKEEQRLAELLGWERDMLR